MQNRSATFFILLFLVLVTSVCVLLEGTPEPLPASAPADVFSADRALVHLNAFATAPHPIGSAEHDRVRDYLVAQLTKLGVTPEIQRTTAVTGRYLVAGTVENIIARVKGTNGASDALALAAHYDSVPAGPGAGDDGAGVAALLETLRALRRGPPLRNDIIFLLTDGEEDGLLGASAFVAEHPWAKDVRVVLNFEGRGNSGASQMFETSAGNGRLVDILAQAAPHPSSSSITYEVYKRMPNDTDMTVFKKTGAAGLNFAFIGDWEAYHTPLDNPHLLDRGSLQQHGEYALSLARSFGNADLARLQDRDAVYFSLPGNFFPHYSSRYIWPLAIASGVFLLALIFYANGAWQTRVSMILLGFLAHVGLLVLLLLVGRGFERGVHWLHLGWLSEGGLEQSAIYTLGLFALLLALQTALYRLLRKKIEAPAFFLGGALLIFALVIVTSKLLPGGSYLFVWPLLAGLLATATAAFRPYRASFSDILVLCLLSLPALLFFALLLKGFYTAIGFTFIGAPVMSVMFALCLLLISPLLDTLLSVSRNFVPLAALVAALGLFIAGAWTTRYSPEHPKPSLLSYALDADTGKALWASSVARVDSWTAHYVTTSPTRAELSYFSPEWYPYDYLVHEAPSLPLPPPVAQLVENSSDGGTRKLHLRVIPPRGTLTIHVSIAQAEVLDASVNGHELGKPSEARRHRAGSWGFDYANPGGVFDLELHVQGTQQVKVVLVDRSSGLPTIPGVSLPPRPADSMPRHSGDQTMVLRSFVF